MRNSLSSLPAAHATERRLVVLPDAVLASLVAASGLAVYAASPETTARSRDLVGAALLVVAATPLLGRRRWPIAGFAVQLALVVAYLASDYPGGAELPVVLAGMYSVADTGRRWWTLGLGLLFAGVASVYRTVVEHEDPLTVSIGASLLLLTALLGDASNMRRALQVETRRRLEIAEAEKESVARARVAEERLRIARELHDLMGHTITAMTVQAGAAADQLSSDPRRAAEALDALRSAARDATSGLRATLGVLRTDDADPSRLVSPGLRDLGGAVALAEQAGVAVTVDLEGLEGVRLDPTAELTCVRFLQEAMTNVVRHAHATKASVRIDRRGSAVIVEVVDDGRGVDAAAQVPGFGLIGLRERVSALGGRVEYGSGDGGGFRVAAVLPARVVRGDDLG